MIGRSFPELVFIRSCIVGLRAVAPVALGYWALRLSVLPLASRLPLPVEIWLCLEGAFFTLVYLPRKWSLQKVPHPQA